MKIDEEMKVMYVSSIMDWFGADFVDTAVEGAEDKILDQTAAVKWFVAKYSDKIDWTTAREYSLEYQSYDWALNEQ